MCVRETSRCPEKLPSLRLFVGVQVVDRVTGDQGRLLWKACSCHDLTWALDMGPSACDP